MGSLRLSMAVGAVAFSLSAAGATAALAQETKPKIPPAGYVMTSPRADHTAYAADSTVISRNSNDNCVTYLYRIADGSVRAKSACGRNESFNQGQWSVRDDGSFCLSWQNSAWNASCYVWTHAGDNRFTWRNNSGLPASGESETVQGNPFGL